MTASTSRTSVALGDLLASVRAGVSLKAESRPARDGERGVLTLSALVAGRLDPAANKAVPDSSVGRLGPSVRAGTILISRSNTEELVGSSVYVEHDHPKLYLPDLIWELDVRPDAGIDPRWLQAYLGSERARRSLKRLTAGTSGSMKKLSMERLRTLRIPRIPPREQRATVQVLESFDAQSKSITQLLRTKRRLKRGLLQQLLTAPARAPQASARAADSLPFSRIAELVTERFGSQNHDDVRPCLELEHLSAGTGQILGWTDTKGTRSQKTAFRPGDVLFGKLRPYLRKFAHPAIAGVCSTEIWVLRARPSVVEPDYLFQLVQSHDFLRAASATSGTKMPRASWRQVSAVKLHVPSPAEQRRIAHVLRTVDREIELLERQVALLRLQRRGVLERLLEAGDADR